MVVTLPFIKHIVHYRTEPNQNFSIKKCRHLFSFHFRRNETKNQCITGSTVVCKALFHTLFEFNVKVELSRGWRAPIEKVLMGGVARESWVAGFGF